MVNKLKPLKVKLHGGRGELEVTASLDELRVTTVNSNGITIKFNIFDDVFNVIVDNTQVFKHKLKTKKTE